MSEQNTQKIEEQASRAAEKPEKIEKAKKAKKDTNKHPGKKHRRRRRVGVPISLTAILLIVALLFGLVFGYAYGRKRSQDAIDSLKTSNSMLSDQLEGAIGEEVDIFTDTLTPEEEAALGELSGEGMEADDNELVGALSSDVFGEVSEDEEAEDAVVAEYSGKEITASAVRAAYTEQVSDMIFNGYDADIDSAEMLNQVLTGMVQSAVLKEHAQAMGIDTEGDADWQQALRDAIVKDVTITDADAQTYYNDLLATQKKEFATTADTFEFAQISGDIITYNLSGYRAMKVIKLSLDDEAVYSVYEINEQLAKLDPTVDAEKIASLNKDLDILYTTAEARAKSIIEKLDAGASFNDLIDQYGTDEKMADETFREKGYYISAESPLWSADVRSAAMALAAPNDYSQPVRSGDGVYILQYIGDVSEGDVPYAEVQDQIKAQALIERQETVYQAQIDEWMQAADPKYYPERMQ